MKWNRLWLMGLGVFTALVLMVGSGFPGTGFQISSPLSLTALAQSPQPTVSPSPATSPAPAASPSPATSPTPAAPAAAPATTPPSPPAPAPVQIDPLPLSEAPYQDPGQQFEVGVIEGYKVSTVAGVSLMESPDGNLAYSVMVKPQATQEIFNDNTLAQFAVSQLQGGEGFQPDLYQGTATGGILIPWQGKLSIGRSAQPINGVIWAKQEQRNIFLVVISATEAGKDQVLPAFQAISQSFKGK